MTKYEQARFTGPLPSDAYRDNYDRIFRGEEQTPSNSDEPAGDSSPEPYCTQADCPRCQAWNEGTDTGQGCPCCQEALEGYLAGRGRKYDFDGARVALYRGKEYDFNDCPCCPSEFGEGDLDDRLNALDAYLIERIAAQEDADPREMRRIMGWED